MRRGVVLPESGARRRTAATLPAELRVRGGQALASLTERLELALGRGSPTSPSMPHGLTREFRRHPERLLGAVRAGLAGGLLPGLRDLAGTVATLRRVRPEAESATRCRAERAAEGVFDLLGHERVSFGSPIDWHLDPGSGRRTPLTHWSRIQYLDPATAGDYKLRWEVNRHQHFVTLGQAYAYSRDPRYATAFVTQLGGWIAANPPRLGVNWASSLEVSYRAISWLWALQLFADAPELSDRVLLDALESLRQHGRHIARYLSTYYSPNTHLTGEALGLLYLGSTLPCFERAEGWRTLGWRILQEQLPRQVRPDGTYFEQALYYHRYTADIYQHALLLADANGWPREPAVWERVERLAEVLVHTSHPDGTVPLVGDDDGGRLMRLDGLQTRDARPTLATAAALFDRPDMQCVAGDALEESIWLLGEAGARTLLSRAPTRPQGLSRAFRDGGFYVMRDGWGAAGTWALLDGGPHGSLNCGHAHADALSMEVAVGGRLLLADGGTFCYTGEERHAFRATSAHNTVSVDGESSSLVGGLFHWRHVAASAVDDWRSATGYDFWSAAHDGYRRLADPATHSRSVLFVRGRYLIVEDRLSAEGEHAMTAHWHAAPGLEMTTPIDGDVRILDAARSESELAQLLIVGSGRLELGEGWRSEAYGSRRTAPCCAYRSSGNGAQRIVTVITPGPSRARRAVQSEGDDGISVDVMGSRWQDRILLRGSASTISAPGLVTDARMVVLRQGESPEPDSVLLVGASYLESEGQARTAVPSVHVTSARCVHGRWTLDEVATPSPAQG